MLLLIFIIIITLLIIIDLHQRFGRTGRLVRKIPGPRSWPIVGNIMSFVLPSDKLFVFRNQMTTVYGNISQVHGLGSYIVQISDPEYLEKIMSSSNNNNKCYPYNMLTCWLQNGLLISNGKKWQQRRKMLTKAFHFNILKSFASTYTEEANKIVKKIREETSKTQTEIFPIFCTSTLNVMFHTAMGKITGNDESVIKGYFNAVELFSHCFTERLGRAWLKSESICQMTGIGKKQNRAVKELHQFTINLIRQRREFLANQNSNPFDEDLDDFNPKDNLAMLDLLLKNEKDGVLDEVGIREEVDTFLFAGYETTAVCLTYLLMALANNPEIQEKAYREICEVCGGDDEPLTVENINKLKYVECCIKESLRIYPSVPAIARDLTQDIELGGYIVPANTTCFIAIYDMHHSANLYPEPERFIPERFLPENSAKRHPYAYIPFSAGPRNCIGQKFALLEIKTMLSALLRKFRLEPVTRPEDIVFKTNLTLTTTNPIYVKFCLR